MAGTKYAGHFLTRRVELAKDERVLRSWNAFRVVPIAFYSFGALTITTHRLIWTPMPYPFDWFSWAADRAEIKSVSVRSLSWWHLPRLSALHVATRRSNRDFGLDSWPIFWRTEGLAKTIRKWANT